MCGIAGIVGSNVAAVAEALSFLTACQRHRGPDDEGIEIVDLGDAALGLGQRRLSIIDLSPAGRQPMVHPDTGDVLIYNGELYNYQELARPLLDLGVRFRGHSDTEVILHSLVRWGPEWLEKTAGMYALAFFERRTRRLLLARDPMGIKPLYVARRQGVLLFASEVRPILATGLVKPEVDPRGLAGLLAHGAVPEPATFFRGVEAFPPGAAQWCDIGRAGETTPGEVIRHWRFPAVDDSLDERAVMERLRPTLDHAVKEHLIADRPVGVFLSSGLDSTIVAGLARRHTAVLRTFTVGFADQPDMSESAIARDSAASFGVEHRDLQITGDQAQAATMDWLASMDQPSFDGLNTYVISQAVREAGIVVALSGLGGDELFGGYSSFTDVPAAVRRLRALAWVPPAARARLAALAAMGKRPMARERASDMGRIGPDPLRLYLERRRAISSVRLRAMGFHHRDLGLDQSYIPLEAIAAARETDAGDVVAAVSRYESAFYMRNMLLRDSDTNGMAHSLEIRVPLLDRRMLDLAYTIPGRVRLPGAAADKHLLRVCFPDLLAAPVLSQAKRGFTLPIRRWMMGPLRDVCESAMLQVRRSGLLEAREADRVWRDFTNAPDAPGWSSAFLLCVLGNYLHKVDRWREPGGARVLLTGAPRGAAGLESVTIA